MLPEFLFATGVVFILGLAVWLLQALLKLFRSGKVNFQIPPDGEEELSATRTVFLFIIIAIATGFPLWYLIAHLGWEAHVLDWLHLILRWFHVVIGIAWIGASFYFIFLENSLNRTEGLRDELAGNLWAVHGGGFYYLEKYKTAPGALPKTLHWFKYEAYFTWISGIYLLFLVYYFHADATLLDPQISNIKPDTAIFIGIGSIVLGWFLYDGLCRTPLISKTRWFAALGFLFLVGISWGLSQFLSGRAVFMHIGALLGTIMAGNVFFVIIPAQKALVRAAKAGLPPDPSRGKYAGLRSLHNNYTTLPVVFVMFSNHFPTTYGCSWNWVVLALLILGSVSVRHFINLHEKGISSFRLLGGAAICLVLAIWLSAPEVRKESLTAEHIEWKDVQPIFQKRCVSCHADQPKDEVYKVAPAGARFETWEQCQKTTSKILNRVVETKTMPQGNKTGMTDEERDLIANWIAQGAKP